MVAGGRTDQNSNPTATAGVIGPADPKSPAHGVQADSKKSISTYLHRSVCIINRFILAVLALHTSAYTLEMGTTAPSDGASLPSSTAAAAPVPVPVPAASSSAATIPSPNASVGSSHSEHDHPQHVLILYASETGNAQDMAERVARAFRAAHRRAITLSMDEYDVKDLPHESLIVFITSTHGRGDPPPAMRKLWNRLIRKGLPHDILEGALTEAR